MLILRVNSSVYISVNQDRMQKTSLHLFLLSPFCTHRNGNRFCIQTDGGSMGRATHPKFSRDSGACLWHCSVIGSTSL